MNVHENEITADSTDAATLGIATEPVAETGNNTQNKTCQMAGGEAMTCFENTLLAGTVPAGQQTAANVPSQVDPATNGGVSDVMGEVSGHVEIVAQEVGRADTHGVATADVSLGAAKSGDKANPEKGKSGKGKPLDAHVVMIPFAQIGVSVWNESYGTIFNEDHIKDLADDIKKNGLMHPIVLAVNKDPAGPKYTIPAGARRFAALKHMRGEASGLQLGEFAIHNRLNESDPKCLDFSLSENNRRYGRSVLDRAQFIDRVVSQKNVDQKKLAKQYGIPRETVCRLAQLSKYQQALPECWRKDFAFTPKSGGKGPKKSELPRITVSHWIAVVPYLVEEGGTISGTVMELMTKSHAKRWSIRKLRSELEQAHLATDGGAGKADAKADKAQQLERTRTLKTLRDAMKLVDPELANLIQTSLANMEGANIAVASASESRAELGRSQMDRECEGSSAGIAAESEDAPRSNAGGADSVSAEGNQQVA